MGSEWGGLGEGTPKWVASFDRGGGGDGGVSEVCGVGELYR